MTMPLYLRRKQAARYIQEKWGLPVAANTLAKYATIGLGGPPWVRYSRFPMYAVEDIDAWAEAAISRFNRFIFDGRELKCNLARPREERGRGRRSGYRDDRRY